MVTLTNTIQQNDLLTGTKIGTRLIKETKMNCLNKNKKDMSLVLITDSG